MLRSRKFIASVIAAYTAAAAPFALAAAGDASNEQSTSPTASASVVRVERITPRRKIVFHRKFRPWRHPSPRQVQLAIRAEAQRWHIPAASLSRRTYCESKYRWWASNGQYVGVLQFGSNAFYRGLRSIRDRDVRLVKRRVRKRYSARIVHYSDGHVTRKRGRARRQVLVVVYTGRLPRHPGIADTWTQLRIGAQAIRGISAVRSSEWSCGA